MTQTHLILEHLKSGKSITPLEALDLFGCLRLGARIMDLRKEGYDIQTEIVELNGKHFAKYFWGPGNTSHGVGDFKAGAFKSPSPDSFKLQTQLWSAA